MLRNYKIPWMFSLNGTAVSSADIHSIFVIAVTCFPFTNLDLVHRISYKCALPDFEPEPIFFN